MVNPITLVDWKILLILYVLFYNAVEIQCLKKRFQKSRHIENLIEIKSEKLYCIFIFSNLFKLIPLIPEMIEV